MTRIDSHVHLWRVARGDYFWMDPSVERIYRDYEPADLQPLLAAAGLDRAVVVQAADTVAETEFMLDLAARSASIAGVVGWAPFDRPEGPDVLARLAENPLFKGVRPMIQEIPDDDWMLGETLGPSFRAAVELDIALDAQVRPRHLANLYKLLQRHPDLKLVIDHAGKPEIAEGHFETWAGDMRRLAADTAALVKFSGLVNEADLAWSVDDLRPYAELLFERFGPERIMFGSDWPVVRLAAEYDAWFRAAEALTAGLDEADIDRIFGATAARFYGL